MPRASQSGLVRRILATVLLATVGVVGVAGSYAAGTWSVGFSADDMVDSLELESAVNEQIPAARPMPAVEVAALRIPTCSIATTLEAQELGSFAGIVVDPMTDEILFARNSAEALAPASVQKVLTAAAALTTLGPDTTFQTSTWVGNDAETLVLKAGGDLTLSATAAGTDSVYVGAAKLSDLAQQTIDALGATLPEGDKVTIRNLVIDASLWDSEDNWREAWASSARSNGYISRITPLQIDGDRFNPGGVMSQRSNDPIGRAASAFVSALRKAGNTARFVTITYSVTPPDATQVSSVSSRPVSELVNYMLKESDNTLAEMLGRHVSLAQGFGGTGDSIGEALLSSLSAVGLDQDALSLDDASGLSPENRITPDYVASLLAQIYRNEEVLSLMKAGFPVAGVDGSLDDRFDGPNEVLQGKVFAKTGSIQGVRSLAGWVMAEDGSDLVFAFFASGDVSDSARGALEAVVAGVYGCGSNLADF